MCSTKTKRGNKGIFTLEALCGFFIIIPLTLTMVDMYALFIAHSANDRLAYNAALAASKQVDGPQALKAAKKIIDGLKQNGIITKVTLEKIDYEPNQDFVVVRTSVEARVPAPLVGFSNVRFEKEFTQPLTGLKPLTE